MDEDAGNCEVDVPIAELDRDSEDCEVELPIAELEPQPYGFVQVVPGVEDDVPGWRCGS
jgi:hypothetical protein